MANLSSGSRGPDVVSLQHALNRLGASPQLAEDGDFGPATDRAVRAFQAAAGLSVDGVVGPQTSGAISSALDALNRSSAPARAPAKAGGGLGKMLLGGGLLLGLWKLRRKKK